MTWKVPGYVAERLIGYGASSEVWQGRSTRTGQQVALKKVFASKPEQLKSARTEAALLATLDHPNLIRIHEAVPAADALVLVLDLADAGSLADLLQARGRLTAGEVASALAAAGAALAYAHAQRVIHGDVSAGNVLFTSIGLTLLADLGGGRIAGDDAPIHGTAAYVAPEVAAGSLAQAPSDVFSLAAVAFHALTGSVLWPGPSSEEMVEHARRGEMAELESRLAEVPPQVAALLIRTLTVEAFQRPTAAEFALDLRLSVPLEPIELTAGRPRPELLPPAVGRHRRLANGQPARVDPGRPRFERPPPVAPDRGQLTHGVRIALAVAPARRRPWRRWASRRVVVATIGILAALAVAGVSLSWLRDRPAAAAAPSGAISSHSVPSPGRSSPMQADFAATLTALDVLRQQAFAQRRPELLSEVYGSADLRAQDAALITQLVPSGCGLLGVRTTYRDVRVVSRSGAGVVLSASAELTPSTLQCGATSSGSAAGLPSTPIRIGLTRSGPSYLITSIETM
jgi:hypothetical protein